MHKTYENLYEMLEKEANNIEQSKSLTKDSLEVLYYVTGTMDHLKCLMGNEDYGMSGHMPYYNNMSGARRRDSMGRYMDMNGSFGYNDDGSKHYMVQKLSTMMNEATNENDRRAIEECINRIRY